MTKFGYEDLSNIKVNKNPLKNTETIMTLTNPYNDKKIIIEYDKAGNIIRMISPSHRGDVEFIKYDSNALEYTIKEDSIDLSNKYNYSAPYDCVNMVFTYDKSFNLLKVTFNDNVVSDYINKE